MSSAQAEAPAAPPAPSQRSGLLTAAANIGRYLVILGVLLVLVAVRTTAGLVGGIVLTGVAVAGVYVAFGRRRGMSELLVYLLGFALFAQLRTFGDRIGIATSYTYAWQADKAVFGVVPSAWLQNHLYSAGHASILAFGASGIYLSYFVVVHAVALFLWARRRDLFGLYAGAMLLCFYTGLLACFLVPTAPPWLASQHGDITGVHRIFQELVNGVNQNAYASGASAVGQNDVAAMPSLHMAITVLIALFAWRCHRGLGLLGTLYAAAMGCSLVFLGEHYVTDVVAGIGFAGLSWLVALRLWRPRSINQGVVPQPGSRLALPAVATGELAA